jgi:hypothetical protein
VGITIIEVEMVVAPNMDFVRRGVLCSKIGQWIGWRLDKKEFELKFGTTYSN